MKRIFRMKDICQAYGLSRSTIYRMVEGGIFPKPIKIGAKAVGWCSEDLDAWFNARREAV
jgi:prophage regulatory protein